MKLFAEKKKSSKSENTYVALYIDMGYRKALITMDTALISELADMSVREINALEVGRPHDIGEVIIKSVHI